MQIKELMNRDDLVQSARSLSPPTSEAASAYEQARDAMVLEVNQRMRNIPGIAGIVGQGNMALMLENHRNHAEFMSGLLMLFHPEVLVETVLWVFRTYRARGFQPEYWHHQLNTWVTVIQEYLSPETAREVLPIYKWLLKHTDDFAHLHTE